MVRGASSTAQETASDTGVTVDDVGWALDFSGWPLREGPECLTITLCS